MAYGLDTDFLLAVEIVDHPFHQRADALLQFLLNDGQDFYPPEHEERLMAEFDC